MERLTEEAWGNLDPWECCGQDHFCTRGCHDPGGCTGGCIVPQLYKRLAVYEDAMPLERAQELAQAEKDGRPPVTPRAKTYDAHTAEAEYLLGVLWNGLHNNDGMDSKVADRVAEIAHEGDKVQPATTPKNDPLTLDELLEMDGEPVWLEREQSAYYDVLHIFEFS